ncbi:MAG: prolyl oligopeptidase family serine peptidase [Nocardioides sp.]
MRRRSLFTLAALGAAAVACGPAEQKQKEPPVSEGAEFIRYGDAVGQFGELSRPEGDPRGLVVVVHGGFWKPEYGIEYAQPLVPSLVEAGWAAWVLEYRRGSGSDDTLADVRAAIDAAPIETDLVIGLGHSAGGHLVTWAAAGGGLTHVVSQAGVLDLRAAHDAGLGGGAVEAFLGHPPGPDDADVDPIQQVPLAVPVWCVHGTDDTIVPISQSEAYVAAATSAGAIAELVEVEGDHFAVIEPDTEAWSRQLALLNTFA